MDNNDKIPYELIIRSFKDIMSEADSEELQEWLSNPDNEKIYIKLRHVWEKSQANAAKGLPDIDSSWRKLKQSTRSPFYVSAFPKFAAAAAIVAVAFLAGHYYKANKVATPESETISTVTFASNTGKSTVILPDGTHVTLKQGSTLAYNSDFGKVDRNIKLEGEAYFDVTKNPEKMFRVHVSDVEVDVHGTAFNVDDSKEALTVSLLRGAVSVDSESGLECSLIPGQKASYDKKMRTMTVSDTDADFDALWTKSTLSFKAKNLDYVCKYLSQWYGKTITPEHSMAGKFAYTFTITDENLDDVLKLMKTTTPIRFRYTKDNNVIIY
jgi:transmembrane sensor